MKYQEAIDTFNELLESNEQVAQIAKHYNKTIQDVVRRCQPCIVVFRKKNGDVKEVLISMLERGSGIYVAQIMKVHKS